MITPAQASDAGAELYAAAGPLAAGDADRGYPLLTFLESFARLLQTVDDLGRDDASGPGWSALLDPARCPTSALPWLGQFVGAVIDPTAPDAVQRAQIMAHSAWVRGRPDTIVAVARQYLSGNQAVRLVERDYGDPYTLTVIVYGTQVDGQSYGQLSRAFASYADLSAGFATYADFSSGLDELTLALQQAVPAGIVVNLQVSAGQLYSDLTSGPWGSSYSATSGHYPTYAAMTSAAPGT